MPAYRPGAHRRYAETAINSVFTAGAPVHTIAWFELAFKGVHQTFFAKTLFFT